MNKHTWMNYLLFASLIFAGSCGDNNSMSGDKDILGFELLEDVTGHWVGSNETAFGFFDWFAFDFRPISSSHTHSIYEGSTNSNIITSFFIADFEGKQQIMARNGGWLGNQYRATYFVLDRAEITNDSRFYRLVDAIGKDKRSYMELRFEKDTFYFDAFKDNSGSLDEPIHHMGFKGTNFNPSFAQAATAQFDFPKKESEVNLNDKFVNLIDPESALFLEEAADPFPKSVHGHLSDLTIEFNRATDIQGKNLILFISRSPIVDASGNVNFDNLNSQTIRTIEVAANENAYTTTYLHPDEYYLTAFSDSDGNQFPSQGDFSSFSKKIEIVPESNASTNLEVNIKI